VTGNPLLPPLEAAGEAAAKEEGEEEEGGQQGRVEGLQPRPTGTAAAAEAVRGGPRGVEEEEEEEAAAAAAAAAGDEPSPEALQRRLDALVDYLRGRYCFCLFCGTEFEGAEDMGRHCPGPGEEDHE
jgi:hypothetical protein